MTSIDARREKAEARKKLQAEAEITHNDAGPKGTVPGKRKSP